MAEKTTSADQSRIEDTALELFSRMPAGANYSAEQQAEVAFKRAKAFHAVAGKVSRGELNPGAAKPEDQLTDASAPNLKQDHPLNRISKRFGSVESRQELLNRLRNPKAHGMSLTADDPGRNIPYLESLLGTTAEELQTSAAN